MSRTTFPNPGPRVGPPATGALDPYRRAVRRHPLIVVLTVLVTVVAAIGYLSVRSSEYHATAQILVTPAADDPSLVGLPILTESVDPTRTLQTGATVLTSPRAAQLAAKRLGSGTSLAAVLSGVSVQPQGNSEVVAVTATADSGPSAARLANAYAQAALDARSESLKRQLATKLASVQTRQKALGKSDTAAAAALAGQVSTLQSLGDGQDPNFSLLQSASAPSAPSGTKSWLVIVLAVLVGLALGTAAALAMEQLDRRVRDEDELSEQTNLPVLARVPLDRHAGNDPLPAPPVLEALRSLQIQLEARTRNGESRAIVVTSPSEGDGKTTTAIALARTLASSGRRVILLDFDLRKSEIGARLGVRSDLLRMLRTDGRLSDILVTVPGTRQLRVLSPPAVGDVGALFDAYTRQLPQLVDQARQLADYVVIDTPPLGRVADALRLMSHVDEVLLVARPGTTDRRELSITLETLEQLGITPSGLIMVGGSRKVTGYYGFSGEIEPALARLEAAGGARGNGNGNGAPAPESVPTGASPAARSAAMP